jgi:2-oxoglutarate ferredoxin oxidoreductase subunit alpha
VRIAVKYRSPVILLSDTFLANSSEPWRIPALDDLPELDPGFAREPNQGDSFWPYLRNDDLARPWAIPGTPGLEHRIGGLEKEEGTGNISYEPENHALMTRIRAERVAKVAEDAPDLEVDHDEGAEVLVLGWGSSYGTIRAAARRVRQRGHPVAVAHLHLLNPLPRNTGDVVRSYRKVIVPEMNTGQLVKIIRAEFLVDAESVTKVEGLPFFADELEREILARLREPAGESE